jgi:iron complex outermembrane receptor protein
MLKSARNLLNVQFLGTAGALAALIAYQSPAFAQNDGGASVTSAAPAASAETPAATTTQEQPTGIETVVVTATRREELLKDVPLAISALTSEDIKQYRIRSFNDVVQRVPGLRLAPTKGDTFTQIYIRGQTQNNQSVGLDTPVAFFQDDLYYGTTASYVADFYDTSQIAVLKGPQGTTFGRNVDGGAIQVTSAKPEMGVNETYVNATVENYSGAEVWGYVNRQLSDTLAARISVVSRNRDGYDKNVYLNTDLNDNHSLGARAQLRWEPTSNLNAELLASWYHTNNNGTATKYIGQGIWAAYQAAQTGNDPHKVYSGVAGYQKRDVGVLALHVNWNTEFGTVQSITGVHTMHANFQEDVDDLIDPIYYPAYNINKETAYSQEIRLVSPSQGVITYVAGLYGDITHEYMNQDQSWDATQLVLGQPSRFRAIQAAVVGPLITQGNILMGMDIKTFAPYFEGKWHITDDLGFTAGVRYTITNKSGYNNHTGPSFSYGAIPYNLQGLDHTWYELTPRFILDYHIRPDLMVYASVSNGVKSGGWSFSAPTAALAAQGLAPENNWSYEVGVKGSFFDDRVTTTLALYNAVTWNAQIKNLVNGIFIDANAGHITTNGVELSVDLRPIDPWHIGANWAYTDAYYGKFKPCNAAGADCSGNPLIGVPLNDLQVYTNYDFVLPNNIGDVLFNMDARLASSVSLDPTGKNILPLAQPYTNVPGIIDTSFTFTPSDAPWTVQLWAKNITDRNYLTVAANYYFFALTQSEFAGGLREADRVAYNNPRTFGVTVDYKF